MPSRYNALPNLIIVLAVSLYWPSLTVADDAALLDHARQVHKRIITIDTHVDISPKFATEALDPGEDGPLQVDLPKMLEGGLDASFFIVYVGQGPLTDEGYKAAYDAAIAKFDAIDRQTALYGHIIQPATTADEVAKIAYSGKLVSLIGVENGYSLGPNAEHIAEFYKRGARYMGLTHIGNNDLAASSIQRGHLDGSKEPTHKGLTKLGKRAIAEMNRLGVMVDVSHASRQTTLDAVKASKAPVIASHSVFQKFNNIPRNLSEKELRAIARSGGVVQVVAFDTYMKQATPEKIIAIGKIREEMGLISIAAFRAATPDQFAELRTRVNALDTTWPRATVQDLVDQIDYGVSIVGIDHIGIASDFGGGGGIAGWDDASETFAVTMELVRRGYAEDEIEKIWGGNLLRVMRQVETVSQNFGH